MNSTTRTGRPWAAALQRGITEALNARGAAVGCGPLAWSLHAVDDGWRWLGLDTGRVLLNGHVAADVAAAGAGAVACGWARELQLAQCDDPICAGTVEYRGEVDGMYVIVWAVVDGEAFHRQAASS